MERAVVHAVLFGLLLASVTSLPSREDWDIYSFHINSTVTSRYATTVITSRVANRMDESKEIEFHVRIPKNAFISKFKMIMDGQAYDGVVKVKEQAQKQYDDAVSQGQSAGIVSSVGRTLEEFRTSVTVGAHKKVTFELTYEELLKRRLGKYELQIHARPMQPVKDFKVDVYIHEKSSISFVKVQGGLSTNALANAVTKTHANNQAWVHFYPTVDQQKMCDSCGDNGMNGDLIILYDVDRNVSMGDIETSDGYFVHHFAPQNLARIPKNVVFIIDQSGSMHGKKIHQTRIALNHILGDLEEDDFFGLISFDSEIFHWKRELVQASEQNLKGAKEFAENIQDRGATDINRAVLEGARMLNANPREGAASILILLTDGDPTSGVTNLNQIKSNVKRAIADKFPLYCLGFGYDVNFEFLKTMSLQNSGAARRIYEDSDADLQLKGFYKEVATPLLTDVTMIYLGGTNLTQTNFSQYYDGSEIVVAGQITDNGETFVPQVVAISGTRKLTFSETNVTETVTDEQIQRVWAYLTVKQLLEKELRLSGLEKDEVKKEAMRLSLKYNFVTPLTSMVVTKPPGESTDVLHKPEEGATHIEPRGSFPGRIPGGLPGMVGAAGVPGRGRTHFRLGGTSTHQIHRMPTRNYHPGIPAHYPAPSRVPSRDFAILKDSRVPQIAHDIFEEEAEDMLLIAADISEPLSHRFLLKNDNKTIPLCFDVLGNERLQLLHSPSRELTVNGELDSIQKGGFRKIVIRVKTDLIDIDVNQVTVQEGQNVTRHTGLETITVGSVTVIKRSKEIDVAVGDIRFLILLHEKDGETFLWPALRAQPADSSTGGFLTLECPEAALDKQRTDIVTINGQVLLGEIVGAVDYSISASYTPTMGCFLVPAQVALQRPLPDFIVPQL